MTTTATGMITHASQTVLLSTEMMPPNNAKKCVRMELQVTVPTCAKINANMENMNMRASATQTVKICRDYTLITSPENASMNALKIPSHSLILSLIAVFLFALMTTMAIPKIEHAWNTALTSSISKQTWIFVWIPAPSNNMQIRVIWRVWMTAYLTITPI